VSRGCGIVDRARRYSTAGLEKLLGLVLLAAYITIIVGVAAGVTYAVIRIFPTQRTPAKPDGTDPPASNRGSESLQGRLFRRAKREAT
jgi:hypothetical protein